MIACSGVCTVAVHTSRYKQLHDCFHAVLLILEPACNAYAPVVGITLIWLSMNSYAYCLYNYVSINLGGTLILHDCGETPVKL